MICLSILHEVHAMMISVLIICQMDAGRAHCDGSLHVATSFKVINTLSADLSSSCLAPVRLGSLCCATCMASAKT